MLAFVHIEKAAGTTLNHILRRNYLFRYCDVRPLHSESSGIFTLKDMERYLQIFPSLECISGHAVKSYGTLMDFEGLQFITLMRDPVKRYVSQYQHWVEKKYVDLNFQDFLKIDSVKNFQTKKIAGSDDVEKACRILDDYFLVGTVEKIDEFLILLRRKLESEGVSSFDPAYDKRNTAKQKGMSDEIISRYRKEIEEHNRADILLYKYVTEHIRVKNIHIYGPGFLEDLEGFVGDHKISIKGKMKSYADYLYRKLYINPVTGRIRVKNGLRKNGSYQ